MQYEQGYIHQPIRVTARQADALMKFHSRRGWDAVISKPKRPWAFLSFCGFLSGIALAAGSNIMNIAWLAFGAGYFIADHIKYHRRK